MALVKGQTRKMTTTVHLKGQGLLTAHKTKKYNVPTFSDLHCFLFHNMHQEKLNNNGDKIQIVFLGGGQGMKGS